MAFAPRRTSCHTISGFCARLDLFMARREGKAVRYELARGVQADSKGINLGCCSLMFSSVDQRRKIL